jgi:hypothetical protein
MNHNSGTPGIDREWAEIDTAIANRAADIAMKLNKRLTEEHHMSAQFALQLVQAAMPAIIAAVS